MEPTEDEDNFINSHRNSRLSVSSPGRLLLTPEVDPRASTDSDDEKLIYQPSPSNSHHKHHARGESLSGKAIQLMILRNGEFPEDQAPSSESADLGEVLLAPFSPSPSPQATVRRILRDDGSSDAWSGKIPPLGLHSAEQGATALCPAIPTPSTPLISSPTSIPSPSTPTTHVSVPSGIPSISSGTATMSNDLYNYYPYPDSAPQRPATSYLRSSHDSIDMNSNVLPDMSCPPVSARNAASLKHLSCFSRLFPNLWIVLILSTVWILLLVYGEYSYPHSHAQFCRSYLPKDSLLSRAVIIANPSLSEPPSSDGPFSFIEDIATRFSMFLADYNMRRNYRIMLENCSPQAVIFSGTILNNRASRWTSDNPFMTVDEESYLRLLKRFNWIFPRTPGGGGPNIHFAPHKTDLNFHNFPSPPALEAERKLLLQRFLDYFGPINWKIELGPFTIGSLFTPVLTSADDQDEVPGFPSKNPNFKKSHQILGTSNYDPSSSSGKIWKDTMSALHNLESNPHNHLIILSPSSFYPDFNASCYDEDQDAFLDMTAVKNQGLNAGVSQALLQRLRPHTIISNGPYPACTYRHMSTQTFETLTVSYSHMETSKGPGMLVLEARNTTLVESFGAYSLLSSFVNVKKYQTPFDLNTAFYDTTTYMDMKTSYLWLVFFSIVGCMAYLNSTGRSYIDSSIITTSSLVELNITIGKFVAIAVIMIMRAAISRCTTPPQLLALPPDLEVGEVETPTLFSQPSRILRWFSLRIQIMLELFMLSSVIVVPWCIMIMKHWM